MKDFRPCLKGLWSLLVPVLPQVLGSAFLSCLQVACGLVFVWYSKRVVDIATGALDLSLRTNIIILILIMLAQVILIVASRRVEGYITVKAKLDIRSRAFDKALKSEWKGRDKYHSADVVNRLEEDIRVVSEFLCVTFPSCLVTLVQLIAACVMLFSFSSSLALILIWIMPVAVISSRLYFRKMRSLSTELRTIDGQIQGHIQEHLQGRVLVKSLSAEQVVEEKLEELQNQELSKTSQRLNYSVVSRFFMQAGFSAGYLTAFIWGVLGLQSGSVSYGLMVAFLQLVGQVQRPVASFASYVPAFIRALSSEERLLDIEEMLDDKSGEPVVLDGLLSLSIKDLTFSYDGQRDIFQHFNCEFAAGELSAVCGPTGRGKSTLANLILGLLRPQEGSILLSNGSQSVEVGPNTRANIMYVPQGNTLFSGTVRENLLLARPGASEQELSEVLHTAAADFIFDLPLGLDTPCSEIGRGLSEGQSQRISIARALLKEGGILILDEATSALDPATELTVLERLQDRYYGKKTIICITHRLAVSDAADRVINL